jgi:hypothetical protein
VDDRPARRQPPAAALRARLRGSPRVVALYRGARGFVLGGKDRDATGRGRSAVEDGVRLLPRAGLTPSPRTGYRLNLVLSTLDRADVRRDRTASMFEAVAGDVRSAGSSRSGGRVARRRASRPTRRSLGEDPRTPRSSRSASLGHARRARRRRLRGRVLDDRHLVAGSPLAGRHQRMAPPASATSSRTSSRGSTPGPRSGCWRARRTPTPPARSASSTPRACATTSIDRDPVRD